MTAIELPLVYRSPGWYEHRRHTVSSSDIAVILGLSPWRSPFDLWWEKRTGEQSQPENDDMRRGRRFEPLIIEDFAAEHPEFVVWQNDKTFANADREWQTATPDGFAYESPDSDPLAGVEAKTAFSRDEWGEPGGDDIPVYYRAQVLWQMDVCDLNSVFLPVWFGTTYAEYEVERDDDDLAFMRDRAEAFLASLEADQQPDIDDSTATARRLKKLHPLVVDGDVEVSPHVLAQYHAAKRLRDAAEARMRLAENRIRHRIGDHKTAVVDGRKVASRSVYDVAERTQTIRAHTVNRLNIRKPN